MRMRPFFSATIVLVAAILLAGCAEKEKPDPVLTVKSWIPKIQNAISTRDLKTLDAMGSDRFDAAKFVDDVYRHGVRGDVTLRFQRIRSISGEVMLIVIASFGPQNSGGIKEITLTFIGDDQRLDGYSIRDQFIPPPIEENIMDSPGGDTTGSGPS